jgi:hypothetical protein
VSTSAKTVSICAPRSWERSAPSRRRRMGAWTPVTLRRRTPPIGSTSSEVSDIIGRWWRTLIDAVGEAPAPVT